MAITFDNLIIDRALDGIFEAQDGTILGALNQLQNLSINTTSESKDKTDAQGVLIKRFFTAKSVEVTGENALFSLSLAGLQMGGTKQVATAEDKIVLPRIFRVNVADGATVTLPDTPIDGTLTVYGCTAAGVAAPELAYVLGDAAGEGTFSLADGVLSLPTDASGVVQIKYEYESETGVKAVQYANKFPSTCKFTLSVLVCDACDKETLRHAYIVFPSFQLSPDFDLTLDTDTAQSFSGTAQVDYCSIDKQLFYIAISEDDIQA